MKKIILATVLTLASVGTACASVGVGVVDMQKVFKTAPELKNIQEKLNVRFSSERKQLTVGIAKLRKDQANLIKNRATMSSKQLSALKASIKDEQVSLQSLQGTYQKAMIAEQRKVMKAFIEKLKNTAQSVAKEDSLDVVLVNTSVLYANHSKDITDELVSKL